MPGGAGDSFTHNMVGEHPRYFFAWRACQEHQWTLGPASEELPRLRILELAPGPRTNRWVDASGGTWEAREDPRLERVLTTPGQNLRPVELLTMSAWYHDRHGLEPWLPGSTCDCFLVSLPYPFGSELEICNLPEGHLHVFWLLPITAAEREFKVSEGLEALEQRFEASALEYWIPGRASVV